MAFGGTAAYLLGAERLFENEPMVEIDELAIADGGAKGSKLIDTAVLI